MKLNNRKGQLSYRVGKQFCCIGIIVGTVTACSAAGLNDETPTPQEAPESHVPEDPPINATNVLIVPSELPVEDGQGFFDCGWFTTVWNGDPHYFFTNQSGEQIELFIDQELRTELGGLMSFDRKLVSVTGVRVNVPREGLQVTSIISEESCD